VQAQQMATIKHLPNLW